MNMSMKASAFALAIAALPLVSCGGGNKGSETQNSVDALKNAADQSAGPARETLLNEADRLQGQNIQVPPGDPNSPVQQAMNKAGNVQAAQEQGTPPAQAQPWGAAKGNPPPTSGPNQPQPRQP